MAAVDVGDVIRVDIIGDTNDVEDIVQTMQFVAQIGPTEDAEDVLSDIEGLWGLLWDLIKAGISIYTIYRRIKVSNMTQGTLLGTRTLSPPSAGQGTGNLLPLQATGVVSFLTSVPRVIPKKMLGGWTEDSIDSDGTWSGSAINQLAAYGAQLLLPYIGTTTSYRYGYDSPKTMTFVKPTSALVSPVAGARRSRKPGVGS